ncbi:MAG: hypothetical protein ACQESR_04635 [Planctomycetota bacterium]
MAGLTLIGGAAGLYFGAHRALRHEPAFYTQALETPSVDQQRAGGEFERNVLELHHDLRDKGQWKRVFTDSQINGWLAVDLPKKFPELLPPTISQPRVALVPGTLNLAFRYQDAEWSTIINLSMDVHLTEDPNTFGLRVRNARAGWIPMPLGNFLDQISQAARRADLRLRWAQQDGDPVALITVPREPDNGDSKPIIIEAIDIGEGTLMIAGRKGTIGEQSRAPEGDAPKASP